MIHRFSLKNFHSVDKEVTVDFVVDDKTPHTDRYARLKSGTRVSLVQALIGPNAAGKTTALRALTFVHWLLTESFPGHRFEKDLPYRPFAGNQDKDRESEISVDFEIEGSIYMYSVSFNQKKIISEKLDVKSLATQRVTTKKLFSRAWNSESDAYDLDDSGFDLPGGYWQSKELGRTSTINVASKFGHQLASKIFRYWNNCVLSNAELYHHYFHSNHRSYGVYDAMRYFGRDEETKKRMETETRTYADFGISGIGDEVIRHKYANGVEFDLEPEEESSGTANFMSISRMIDVVLRDGGIAVIDEFDAYLHPRMFASLLNKFFDPNKNKGKGQLLITTHNLDIFNLIDPKYQLLLVEKSAGGSSELRQIRARADANHLQKYLAGEYGALPDIRRLL